MFVIMHITIIFKEQYNTAAIMEIVPISGVVPILVANQNMTVR